jgi:hypothetical protein
MAALAIMLASLTAWWVSPVSSAVTLIYFDAIPDDGEVLLQWETATELDNAGFYIQRGSTRNGNYQRISGFLPTESDGLSGASYEYTDEDVVNGTTYWYRLESVDYANTSEFSEPVSAVPGLAETPTETATRTSTPTPTSPGDPTSTMDTSSNQSVTPTPTRTVTPTPTRTLAGEIYTRTPTRTIDPAYPGPATTQPPSPTATLSSGAEAGTSVTDRTSPEEAATLIPLPSLTFTFPDGESRSPQALAMAENNTAAGAMSNSPGDSARPGIEPGQILFLAMILLIWLILGAWFLSSLRKLS